MNDDYTVIAIFAIDIWMHLFQDPMITFQAELAEHRH